MGSVSALSLQASVKHFTHATKSFVISSRIPADNNKIADFANSGNRANVYAALSNLSPGRALAVCAG
jgi:hypothetical protein